MIQYRKTCTKFPIIKSHSVTLHTHTHSKYHCIHNWALCMTLSPLFPSFDTVNVWKWRRCRGIEPRLSNPQPDWQPSWCNMSRSRHCTAASFTGTNDGTNWGESAEIRGSRRIQKGRSVVGLKAKVTVRRVQRTTHGLQFGRQQAVVCHTAG
jgi:hypothetical protein